MKKYYLLLIFLGISFALSGQCFIHGTDGGNISSPCTCRVGQTFTACEAGYIISINFGIAEENVATGTWSLWLAEDPGDGNLIGDPVYQTFEVTGADAGNSKTIVLNNLFPVVTGTLYRFEVNAVGQTQWVRIQGNPSDYVDGVLVGGGNHDDPRDLDFGIQIVKPVPTLSQWGMIILSLLMLIIGTAALKQSTLFFNRIHRILNKD